VPLLELRQVTKRFAGLTSLDRVDLELEQGTIAGLIGPNGAGKTTLFNVTTGFYELDGGQIYLDGKRIDGRGPHQVVAAGISRTFQNIRLFPTMPAVENVPVGQHRRLKPGVAGAVLRLPFNRREEREAENEAVRLLGFVGLAGRENALARNLPYGDQRRLEIARALATAPRVLLLDEPTAGMNFQESMEVVQLIRRMRDELGITVLLIEHQMRVVMGVCERITVLDYGVKIAEGTPDEVRGNERVIEAYLGAPDVSA